MHQDNHQSPIAVAYARSLLELANESNQTDAIAAELRDLRQVLDTTPLFDTVLADPAVSTAERANLLKNTFEGRVSQLLYNFLGVLNEKGRIGHLVAITAAFDALLDEQYGKIEVDVTVAQKLDDEQLEQVRHRVSTALKKNAIVHQHVDESIIGGVVLRVQDRLIDGSIRTQLKQMRESLLASRPR